MTPARRDRERNEEGFDVFTTQLRELMGEKSFEMHLKGIDHSAVELEDSVMSIIDSSRTYSSRRFMASGGSPFSNLVLHVTRDPLFRTHPASKFKHHACFGGLAEHTVQVVEIAGAIIESSRFRKRSPEERRVDRVVTGLGALYHDYGKTWDYLVSYDMKKLKIPEISIDDISSSMSIEYSDHAYMIGHISRGVMEWTNAVLSYGDPGPSLGLGKIADEVTHAILAHHQLREWGSPVSPRSPGAWAVHLADMASVNIVEESFKKREEIKKEAK